MRRLRGIDNASVVRCGVPGETLVAYMAEELCDDESTPLKEHMATCLYCQRRLSEFAEVDNLVRSRAHRILAADDPVRMNRVIAEAEALYQRRNNLSVQTPSGLEQRIV